MLNYLNYIKENERGKSPSLDKAINDLEILMEFMGAYENPIGENEYRTISEEEYKKIDGLFDEAVKSVGTYLNDNKNNHELGTEMVRNFNKEFLSKAYLEYKNVKPSDTVSLHESMENFRLEEVKLSNNDLKRVGANLSSRIQLNAEIDGKKVKGVFTPTSYFNPQERYDKILADLKVKYPAYSSFWDTLNDKQFYTAGVVVFSSNLFIDFQTGLAKDKNDRTITQTLDDVGRITYLNGDNGPIGTEFRKYKEDPVFFGALCDFASQAEQFQTYRGMNGFDLGVKEGANIDIRNCAMTSVAKLIGTEDLIANSRQIQIKMPDGKTKVGTFMEFVDGKDVNNLGAIDEMKVLKPEDFDTPTLKKQLADLQVLDYISGNIDRHGGNMLYNIDPKTHKVVGIKGIDNDASFVAYEINKERGLGKLFPVTEMRAINEKMANRILALDESQLEATLHGYGLSEAEVKAAWKRVTDLQEEIKKAKIYDPKDEFPEFRRTSNFVTPLLIVKEEDWDKVPLNRLQSPAVKNYFNTMDSIRNEITLNPAKDRELLKNAEVSRCSLKTMLNPKNTQAMILKSKKDEPFMGTSERYKNVIRALEAYQNAPIPEDLVSQEDSPKWTALNNLKRAVDSYKREKVEIGHLDERGQPLQNFKGKPLKRIHDVDMIGKFVDKVFEQRKEAIQNKKILDKHNLDKQKYEEFKNKSVDEQTNILQDKQLEDEIKNQDLSISILNDINEDNNIIKNDEVKEVKNQKIEKNNNIIQDDENVIE